MLNTIPLWSIHSIATLLLLFSTALFLVVGAFIAIVVFLKITD